MTNIEDELIKRAQAAGTEAFCQLAARYQRRIYSLALHYCHNPQDAEDLSQEVWARQSERSVETIKARRLADVRVLVLDDSPDTVEMLRKLLEIEKALAEPATSGAEALEILRHKKFDLLITDISMPGMDGFEVLRRVRAQPSTATLPAVALTGFGRVEDTVRAKAEGFASHLSKPIKIDELIETLCGVMSSRGV